MIFLDQPYISEFLKNTIKEHQLKACDVGHVITDSNLNLLSEDEAIDHIQKNPDEVVYTTSENAIGWITKNLPFTSYPKQANYFKDKVLFREILKDLYPNFFFKAVNFSEIDSLSIDKLPIPFVIKPAVGFFSLGVHRVNSAEEFNTVKEKIKQEQNEIIGLYPDKVLDTSKYIIEEVIEGDEFAFDAYFDDSGNSSILGLMQHLFSSDKDTSDRVYMTSKKIVSENLARFNDFLLELGNRTSLSNFTVHVEVRIDVNGKLMPIEVNPLRFGGWCTSAELQHHAFGHNQYLNLQNKKGTNWQEVLENADDSITSLVILDNSTGYYSNEIKSFDYTKFLSRFSNPLELRKVDINKFPLFGFLYNKTSENNFDEITNILTSDLREFVELRN